jgi:hypothetical protein
MDRTDRMKANARILLPDVYRRMLAELLAANEKWVRLKSEGIVKVDVGLGWP